MSFCFSIKLSIVDCLKIDRRTIWRLHFVLKTKLYISMEFSIDYGISLARLMSIYDKLVCFWCNIPYEQSEHFDLFWAIYPNFESRHSGTQSQYFDDRKCYSGFKCLDFSERDIALSCSVSRNTVSKICIKDEELNFVWRLDKSVIDEVLEKLIFPEDKSVMNKRMFDDAYICKEFLRNGMEWILWRSLSGWWRISYIFTVLLLLPKGWRKTVYYHAYSS